MNNYKEVVDLYFELKDSPESTRESYWRRMKLFLDFIEKRGFSIEQITLEHIQQFILYLKKERHLKPGTINNYISAIRFFYTYVLEKEWNSRKVPRMKRINRLPIILSKEEVMTLIHSTTNLKHKAMLVLIYGSGLRVSEVVKLKIGDISSKKMWIRVEGAKHGTDRYTILSDFALQTLREYFKSYFSRKSYSREDWLFPGSNKDCHIHVKTIKNTMIKLRDNLGMDSRISAHTLRHCFSTHSLEDGVELVYIQQMLGHKNLETTSKYLHMTSKGLMGIKSPLDPGDS
ncbi:MULTISPECIES: tyrosine-type recombinase/integrase [Bacillaceae]|uniref:Site-specific integrase n=1 Tax=Evansella alkalicola TaxID=745819 RepID=A0ABS6JYP4_9BACI|nr:MULTISPECIES: site-specific integrase [Bacillaceae]MBU9723211.1 site-specific integrase [Bacillus alkalicola]